MAAIETLNDDERELLHFSCMEGVKALRIIDQLEARALELEAQIQTRDARIDQHEVT
jgi:hypothetical protein